ncbi:alpha/beta fold hydrolase [Cellulomonas cellasea]|uniref:Hydrolase n=1 Tax=Cellulomonas cellasea TaxID=43670 RepID=A0A4Y3KT92_9CELL|nr:alpha/beta hydrolase [Cellulomonas cellasea]GEA87213.1 hydrolase [Cellulomonas cellasea]
MTTTPTDTPTPNPADAPAGTVTTGTLDAPGVRLHYEVRGAGPVVALVGAPMGADAFVPIAELLAVDHTVVTTDPRGIGRSPLDDPEQDSTPELRADDLSRILAHLGAGPAAVLGSSGGAVTVLALAQAHPEQVRTVVAHEPPLEQLLDDRERRREALDHMVATYLAEGPGAAWALFLAEANIDEAGEHGPSGAQPEPEDGFPERDPQEVADERRFFLHELRGTALWEPDVEALRTGGPRVVVGLGEGSTGQVCDLTSTALAQRLGTEPVLFPGDHLGFVEEPEAFARRLREVLDAG